MNRFLLFLFFCYSAVCFSQIKGLTEDGKEVVLFENKTWKFVNESDATTLESITTNDKTFERDKSATFLIKSKKINSGVYFNPKEWKLSTQTSFPLVEYMFTQVDTDPQVVGFLLTEKVQIPTYKNLKDIVITNIQRTADYYRLKESEYRMVNGLKFLYLRYVANMKGMDFEYAVYYYLETDGYTAFTVFSSQKVFEKHFAKAQQLLNGLVAVPLGTKEVIYSSPPPPMQPK